MDRENLENTTILQESESEQVLPQKKIGFAATTLTEFFFL